MTKKSRILGKVGKMLHSAIWQREVKMELERREWQGSHRTSGPAVSSPQLQAEQQGSRHLLSVVAPCYRQASELKAAVMLASQDSQNSYKWWLRKREIHTLLFLEFVPKVSVCSRRGSAAGSPP